MSKCIHSVFVGYVGVLCCCGVWGQDVSSSSIASLLQDGTAAMQRGDLVTAQSDFTRATKAVPGSSQAFMGLGLVQLRQGATAAASDSLERAAELDPRLEGVHLFLAIAIYQDGKSDQAVGALQKELALNPSSVEALTWLGIVELGSGRPEQAITPLDRALSLNPKDAQLLYYTARAHSMVAEALYRQLYTQEPDSALVHKALGESLAGSGQPEKAIAEFTLALGKQPQNAEIYEELGEQQQKLSRFDAARVVYEHELQLNPSSPVALYNLGKMDVESGDAAGGVPLLRRAIAAHASGSASAYYLGLGLAQQGSNDEAAHWLEQALVGRPTSFIEQGALFQLGRVYQKLGRKDDAQRTLERLKQLKATSAVTDTPASPSPHAGSH